MPYNSGTERSERIIVHVDAELEHLLPGFLEDWKGETRLMREARHRNDYETIHRLSHDMKGIGGSCGLDVITEKGGCLAEAAKAMDQEAIRRNLDALSYYLERVEFVFE